MLEILGFLFGLILSLFAVGLVLCLIFLLIVGVIYGSVCIKDMLEDLE